MMTRDEMMKAAWVVVLPDGETHTGLDGCWIAITSPEQVDALDEEEAVESVIAPGLRLDLKTLLDWLVIQGYLDGYANKLKED